MHRFPVLTALLMLGGCSGNPAAKQSGNVDNSVLPAVAANAVASNAGAPEPAEAGPNGRELAEGAANLDFIVVNRTGQTIVALSISPKGEESWTDNILAQRDVPPDERAAATFSRDLEECLWDVRATYQNGNRQSWPRINLCDTIRVELR